MNGHEYLDLAGWRRATAAIYREVRAAADPQAAWEAFVTARGRLLKNHPQSPLTEEQRAAFTAIPTFPYDPTWRVAARFESDVETAVREVELAADGLFRTRRIGFLHFERQGQPARLSLYWIEGYGGGLFLPFKDATNQQETFGGGRYLVDTIKGADFGFDAEKIILDFNFVYNPSCAYNARWVCPLSPAENTLAQAVPAGEKRFAPT